MSTERQFHHMIKCWDCEEKEGADMAWFGSLTTAIDHVLETREEKRKENPTASGHYVTITDIMKDQFNQIKEN